MKREEALTLLREVGCPENVITHSEVVSINASAMARKAQKDYEIDLNLAEIGGLLHDIGRACTHAIDHGVVGARLLKERGINSSLQKICERHICAGIPKKVAEVLGLPPRDFIPETIEEKIVCYADNLEGQTLQQLREGWIAFFGDENGQILVALLDSLHRELEKYMT